MKPVALPPPPRLEPAAPRPLREDRAAEPAAAPLDAPLDDPADTAAFAELVHAAVADLRPCTVLDVGCGSGLPTLTAARAGALRVFGVDPLPDNVARARAAFLRASLAHRVTAHRGTWDDLRTGRLPVTAVDLVVSNPPYVPGGVGLAVDGGPTGTAIADALVDHLPFDTPALALLVGSITDPLALLHRLAARDLTVTRALVRPLPFGRYTSRPSTLATLRRLRRAGRAFFCDLPGPSPHAYLTLGLVAQRGAAPTGVPEALTRLLAAFQHAGPSLFGAAASASLP